MSGEHKNSLLSIFAVIIISLMFMVSNHLEKPAQAKILHQDSIDIKLQEKGLVNLKDLQAGFLIDLKYATGDNFTGSPIYQSSRCYLRKSTAEKLVLANREFIKKGYRIKIFDAYRPLSVQWILWSKVEKKYQMYIANPHKGSRHNRGIAVDMTLVDSSGKEIEMPTGFDEFGIRCHSNYAGCSPTAAENRRMLAEIMEKYGFQQETCEWWHFDDFSNLQSPLLDIVF